MRLASQVCINIGACTNTSFGIPSNPHFLLLVSSTDAIHIYFGLVSFRLLRGISDTNNFFLYSSYRQHYQEPLSIYLF